MNEKELDNNQLIYAQALERHQLYATILSDIGMCPGQDRALDESDLRDKVSMFLSSNGGIDPGRASQYSRELVPYYDNYAEGCETGEVAQTLLPKLLSTALMYQGCSGNFERFNAIIDAHTAIVPVDHEKHPAGILDSGSSLQETIKGEIENCADIEAWGLERLDTRTSERQYFKKTLRRLVRSDLLNYDSAKKLSKKAGCGKLWSLDAWLRSK